MRLLLRSVRCFDHHDGVVHHESGDMVNAIRSGYSGYIQRYITPNVPTSDSGTATLGITVARRFRRKRNMTSTTSPMREHQLKLDILNRTRMVSVRSVRI